MSSDPSFLALCGSLGATMIPEVEAASLRVGERSCELRIRRPNKAPPELLLLVPAGPADAPPRPEADPEPMQAGGGPYRGNFPATVPCPQPFELRREIWRDRLGKTLRINREFQTGDPRFDEEVYVECDAPDEIRRALLGSPAARDTVRRCLTGGVEKISLGHDGSLQIHLPFPPGQCPSREVVWPLLGELNVIAGGMPPLRGVWRDTSWASLVPIFSFIWAIFALFPAMIAYACWETMHREPFWAALLGGLGLWALLLPPTFFLLRGRSTALRDLLMTTISNLWGLPCLVLMVGLFLNGALLDGAVERRPVIVERTWVSRGKSTSYHARLSSKERGFKPVEIRVERRVHTNARPPQPATLVYRTGRLGWEILETIELGRLQRQANPSRSRTSMTQPGGMSPFLVRKHTYSFMLFDTDGDGLVERADHDRIVDAACKARRLSGADAERFHAGMAQIWETLEKMVDRDGDHKINLDEWLAFQGGLASNREAWQMAIEGNIRQFLALFDVDGDGALDPKEYAHMLGAYGLPGAVARLNFSRLDLNGDGVISTDELVELVREWSFGEDPAAPGAFLFGPLPG